MSNKIRCAYKNPDEAPSGTPSLCIMAGLIDYRQDPSIFSLALTKLEEDVVEAMKQAAAAIDKINSQIKTVPYDNKHIQTQKANEESTQKQTGGDNLAEATKILVAKHGIDVLAKLQNLNISALRPLATSNRTKRQAKNCPLDDTNCSSQRNTDFRSITGVCNNRANRNLGKAVTAVRRLAGAANYADGLGEIRTRSINAVDMLPSARVISNRLHNEGATPVFDYMTSHLHMQLGQFLAHDIIFMPSSVGPRGENLDCSSCNSPMINPNCAPISVPQNDTYFPPNSCIRLTRALNGQTGFGQRIQINQNTQFADLSAVYGSEECEAASVRSFRNGELLEFNYFGDILPPQHLNDTNCQSASPLFCFLAGDFRSSVQPGLIPLHAAYIKIHNYLAREMRKARPEWNDERTFQEARRVNVAMFQHHIYSEYLPKLLGANTMREFGLTPATQGYFTGYNEGINPSLSAEFTGAAFRFGHSTARRDLPRVDNDNQTVAGSIDIGNNVFYADSLYQIETGGTASMLEGLFQQPAMSVDKEFAFSMRNQIFEVRGRQASGVDLVSVNIMRGRDIGLFPYNVYREAAGLARALNFDALIGEIDRENINALRSVYANVDDIDLYSGILMERPVNQAMIGRTGAYIIAETFRNLKVGDRFFYESQVRNSRGLSPEELAAIRNTSFSKILCMVTPQMRLVSRDAFGLGGPRVACNSLPAIDLRPFTLPPPTTRAPTTLAPTTRPPMVPPLATRPPTIAAPVRNICSTGWTFNGGFCYFFSDNTLSWADAESFCVERDPAGHLASISSAAENTFIQRLYQAKYPSINPDINCYWIGGRSTLNNGNPSPGVPPTPTSFNWTDGTRFTYTNWNSATGEPNNCCEGEPCVEVFEANNLGQVPGTWNDRPCLETLKKNHYACKAPARDQRLCDPNWIYYHPTRSCYFVKTDSNGRQSNLTAANMACRSSGAHLTSIRSASENDFVYDLVKNSFGRSPFLVIFLGMYRVNPPRGTTFANYDGSPFTYTNWDVGQPDNFNNGQDIGTMRSNGKWDDNSSAAIQGGWVCKKPARV